MAVFERLKTDYVDAVFDGYRKYLQLSNPDGTYSFADVTPYTVKGTFFGAKDINMTNKAMNFIMDALRFATDEDIDSIINGTYKEKEEGVESVWIGELASEADINRIVEDSFKTVN